MSRTGPGKGESPSPRPSRRPEYRPPYLIITIAIVAVLLTVGTIVTGFVLASRLGSTQAEPDTGPLAIPAVPAPGADGRYCDALLPALPASLVDKPRRPLVVDTPGTAAWGDPATILRCGVPDPAELTCAAQLTTFTSAAGVSVTWLQISEGSAITYLAVDRPVRIAVTLGAGSGVAPIQQLSEVIGTALPRQEVCTGGTVSPADNS